MKSDGSPKGIVVNVGDSIAYGFDPNIKSWNASAFHGYGEMVARGEGWTSANFAQPGETTRSAFEIDAPTTGAGAPTPRLASAFRNARSTSATTWTRWTR